MFPNTSAQNVIRQDERRRHPRLKVSSIIYAQVGSENGGIVTSLGIDGVAFQAAMKLIAEKNSTLNLRLRGSGLNVELSGELVWLGPTQKEVGVCFKNLTPSVRKEITDWIGREAPDLKTAAAPPASKVPDPGPKPMGPIIAVSANEKKSTSHSLSAALAMSQAMPQATFSRPPSSDNTNDDANRIELTTQVPFNTAPETSVPTPAPEVSLPLQNENVLPNEIVDRPQDYNTDLFPPLKQSEVEQFLDDQSLSKVFQIDKVLQSSAVDLSSVSKHEEPAPVEPEILEHAPEAPTEIENSKAEIVVSPPPPQVRRPPDILHSFKGLEKWIPPALLAAWRQADERRKRMFVSFAAGGLAIVVFIMILAMAHTGSPVVKSVTVVPPPQPANNPVTASVNASSAQEAPVATPALPSVPPPPPSRANHPAQVAQPVSFLDRLFGGDTQVVNQLEENQVGVQVWTSQSSGYYYCTDSDYYKTVQPGAFMEQGDALQSGYRPRLGSFCN